MKSKVLKFSMVEEMTKKQPITIAESESPSVLSHPPAQPEIDLSRFSRRTKFVSSVPEIEEIIEEEIHEEAGVKPSPGTVNRDEMLAKVAAEKTLSLIKAWEDSKKSKAENKAQKMFSELSSWENNKKAAVDAEVRKFEEKLEKKKAEFEEKVQNKRAEIQRRVEEKRAVIEAIKGRDLLVAEEKAAQYKATGKAPRNLPRKLLAKIIGFF